ncbi:MAG: Sua5/YciO/YrdC/YwlC family protein [Gammaproteobacteria bacterium]|nr:Sua5/YciO/YrdC/YwlC family protein [Gammaproteobacteria bacterium]MCY4219333.1 Sua5/YciO/YrdC/YwlC family protein [Gammaproteobacteria bacterium]MCY4275412.1 Sua5/YciO/YrdC/YwlC family protein [Gammaproteobacteria bacterium]
MSLVSIAQGARIIRGGGVIAYPTEGCYGLGCNPMDIDAVKRILSIKRRDYRKGLILISDHVKRLEYYFRCFPEVTKNEILTSWPGPVTWLLPARKNVPKIIRGEHQSIALRVSDHPSVRMLCQQSNMAIVSTSANRSSQQPHRLQKTVLNEFKDDIDGVVEGRIGQRRTPSIIRNGLDGSMIRL